ncbi:MAG: hypothetical protein DBY32_01985 [Phascolarctobacterium sp.]|nr:MAG: hypothetical protein DBY32_01985 [Phascolarctobacterium sp.]
MNFLNKNLVISKSFQKIIKKSFFITVSIATFIFTVLPENIFKEYAVSYSFSDNITIILNRLIFIISLYLLILIIIYLFQNYIKKQIDIKGIGYHIIIKYEDIFHFTNSKKVIAFDECFTLTVGFRTEDIKPNSICGQYLEAHPLTSETLECLITQTGLKPEKSKSKFNSKTKYKSGKLIPRDDFLLLSFAKLDKIGLGKLTRKEFIDCLQVLWEEIDKYYNQEDVCIPILGSGITRFDDRTLTKQELLDLIIMSYKLSPYKIKLPNKLYIVCLKSDDFTLQKIGESI